MKTSFGHFRKIAALILFILFVGLAASTYLSIHTQTGIARKETLDKHRVISDNLAFSIRSSFSTLNWLFVEKQMEELVRSEEVIAVELVKPDGEIYLAARDPGLTSVTEGRFLSQPGQTLLEGRDPRDGTEAIYIVTPLAFGAERWALVVGLSLKSVEETKKRIIRDNLLLGGCLLFLAVGVAFFLAKRFTRPIEELIAGTREIGSGNLAFRIKVASHDEVGALAAAVNEMAEALERTTASRDELARQIEERRQAEKARDEQERLRRQLEERLARSQKLETLGILAGGVAHDLNNVLSGIVTYPDLILMDLPPDSPLRRPISIMQEAGKQAAAIVQDLLALTRRGVMTMQVLSLNEVIKEYLASPEFEKLRADYSGIELRMELAPDLLPVKGSFFHLKKTLANLIMNAVEAMPAGGRVVITTENRTLDRPVMGYQEIREGNFAVLTVKDSGVGIEPAHIQRIFEPFYTKKVMGRSGTGLGMSVVWGTVHDHGGYINVESAVGRGTTFELFFPAAREGQIQKEQPLRLEEYVGKGEKILVVDDVKEQREIAAEILRKLRYEVFTAADGAEAVELIKGKHVDLVVLDMIMAPGMDGLDTFLAIRRLNPGQKAIIASGYSETERVKEALELGVKLYLKKPYTLEGLGVAVRKGLEE